RHDQRIDHDVVGRNAEVGATLDDLFSDGKADVRIHGNAGLVVRYGNHRYVVFLDQRQDRLELLFLAGYGIDQRAALRDLEGRFDRRGDGTVDRQRQVN